jgi:hypothetical protein
MMQLMTLWILCSLSGTFASFDVTGYADDFGDPEDSFFTQTPDLDSDAAIPLSSWSGICYARCMARVVDEKVAILLAIKTIIVLKFAIKAISDVSQCSIVVYSLFCEIPCKNFVF